MAISDTIILSYFPQQICENVIVVYLVLACMRYYYIRETADVPLAVSERRKCIARRSLDGTHDSRETARGSGSRSSARKSGRHHAAPAGREALADAGRQLPKRQSESANRILLASLHPNPTLSLSETLQDESDSRIAMM